MASERNLLSLLRLAYCPFLGPKKISYLEKIFPNLEEIFSANFNYLTFSGLNPELTKNFIIWRKTINQEKILKDLEKENIKFISWHDNNYPLLLKQISYPPAILFYKGNLNNFFSNKNCLALAMVGSRESTAYGEKVIDYLMPDLIKNKIIIVSGLATGIDALSHRAALKNKGLTIAVLGSGLNKNCFYPKRNFYLVEEIIEKNGLILSEFPPNEPAKKQNFPRRNRLISGLTQGVLVIEAKKRSGSLITANFALEQGREVLAIPGNIFLDSSAGSNKLIQDGAIPVLNSEDILNIFKINNLPNNKPKEIGSLSVYQPANENEEAIYEAIKRSNSLGEDLIVDDLILKTKLDSAEINSTLTILELNGAIKNDNGSIQLIS